MKKSSILSFNPEDLIKKREEEEETKELNVKRVRQFIEFFLVSPLLLMFLWKFSIGSIYGDGYLQAKGIDYFQALCLNGVVKVLMRRVEDDKNV